MSKSTGHDTVFTRRLRDARESRGLSQSELADRAGLQPSAVSHFETGRRSPSFHNLRKLSDALGVTIDYLLGRVDQSKAVSPLAEQLFRNLGQMSQEDQENLADFAKMLARKNKKRTEEYATEPEARASAAVRNARARRIGVTCSYGSRKVKSND